MEPFEMIVSARITSEFSAPATQQLQFPFCSCGTTLLSIEETATCLRCGQTLFCEGMRVQVGPNRPDGTPHPHARATGWVAKFMNRYSEPYWLGLPSAMIKLDWSNQPQGFIWVSLVCLEVLPANAAARMLSSVPGLRRLMAPTWREA
jgi:hypothetical protein